MVESVAWISEQKNTLSAVFYFSAMLAYLSFDESRLRSRYFLSIGLFMFGLLTKTVTATLPAALLVIFWWQRGTLSWKRDSCRSCHSLYSAPQPACSPLDRTHAHRRRGRRF